MNTNHELRLVLLVTYGCNLACRYCCVLKELRGRKDMPEKTLFQSVDFLMSSSKPYLQLHFFGAEPLMLPFKRYEKVLPYANALARRKGKNLSIIVTTNGALLQDRWIELFQNERVGLEISLDGDAAAHNANRPQIGGKDSYSRIVANLPKLLGAGLPLQVSMVITPETASQVRENFHHLVSLGFKKIFMMVANCVEWPKDSIKAMEAGLRRLEREYPPLALDKKVLLLNLRDWVWPMRMNTEISVDSDGRIYSACVGYLAQDPDLKARCTLATIGTVEGSIDRYEPRRLRNISAMGVVFSQSKAMNTLASCVRAGNAMARFVERARCRLAEAATEAGR